MSDKSASIETTSGDVALNEIKSALIDNPNLSLDEKRRIMARVRDEFGPHLGAANEVNYLTYLRQLAEVGPSPDEIERWRRVIEAAKTNDERRKWGRELCRWIHKKRRDLARVQHDLDRSKARAARMRTAALETDGWIGGPFQMQRPRGSMLHKLQKAFPSSSPRSRVTPNSRPTRFSSRRPSARRPDGSSTARSRSTPAATSTHGPTSTTSSDGGSR